MDASLETRVAQLEQLVLSLQQLNLVLFNAAFQASGGNQGRIAETLRQLLVSPAVTLDPASVQQIRMLRELLVLPPPQEIVAAAREASLRPVE